MGIILCNDVGKLFWARRAGEDAWQFPQGGIQRDETPEQAVYRELAEEVGLSPEDVTVLKPRKRLYRPRFYGRALTVQI